MNKLIFPAALLLLFAGTVLPVSAHWLVETSLTTAVYQIPAPSGGALIHWTGRLEVGRLWRWAESSFLQISLPLELANIVPVPKGAAGKTQAVCGWPQVAFQLAQPTLWGPKAFVRAQFDPSRAHLGAELGLEAAWDPLLTYAACAFGRENFGLKTGVVFAANRSLALGAHLHYRGLDAAHAASSLTYQLYYQPAQGPAAELTYTYHLYHAKQRLGLMLFF